MQIFVYAVFLYLLALIASDYTKSTTFYKLNGSDYNTTSLSVNTQHATYEPIYNFNERNSIAKYCNITAIRTCQVLSQDMKTKYLAGDNTCSNFSNTTTLWSFLGNPNTSAFVDSIYSQAQSSTLNCTNPERYARYLFTKALPQSFVSNKNIAYNLNNLQSSVIDPCGFCEIFQ